MNFVIALASVASVRHRQDPTYQRHPRRAPPPPDGSLHHRTAPTVTGRLPPPHRGIPEPARSTPPRIPRKSVKQTTVKATPCACVDRGRMTATAVTFSALRGR